MAKHLMKYRSRRIKQSGQRVIHLGFNVLFTELLNGAESKTTVVFFLGGCTYTEIAALRFIAKTEGIHPPEKANGRQADHHCYHGHHQWKYYDKCCSP